MGDGDHQDRPPPRRWRRWRPLVGIVAGGLVLWFVVSTIGGVGEAARALGRLRPGWAAVAVVAGAARMGCYVVQLRTLGRRLGGMRWRDAAEIGLVVYGIGAVLPASPAEGLAAAAFELRRQGHTRRETGLVLAVSEWFTQRAFYTVAAVDLLVTVAAGTMSWSNPVLVVVVGVAILVGWSVLARLARRPGTAEAVGDWLVRLRPGEVPASVDRRRLGREVHDQAVAAVGAPSVRWPLVAVSAAASLLDAATLWSACAGAGIGVGPEGVVLAAVVGTVATWVPLLPAGLGLVEGTVPLVLHRLGAPAADAFAATVVHRAAGTLVPALAGLVVALVARVRWRVATDPPVS